MVKHLPAVQETQVRCLGREDPLEKEMATHSSILAWRISWTEEPGRLQSMGVQRVRHDWATNTHKRSGGDQRCVRDLESHFICSRWSCLPSESLALWVKIMFSRNGTAIVKCIFAKNGMVGEFWIMKSWHYRIIQEMIFFAFKIESESENHSVVSNSLQPHGLYSPWILQARIP